MKHKHHRRNTEEYIQELQQLDQGSLSPAHKILGLSKNEEEEETPEEPKKQRKEVDKVKDALTNLKEDKPNVKGMFSRIYSIPSNAKSKISRMTGQVPRSANVYGSHYPVARILDDNNTLVLHTSDYGTDGKTKELIEKIKNEAPSIFPDFKVLELHHPDYKHSAKAMRIKSEKNLADYFKAASENHPDEEYRKHALDAHLHLTKIKKAEYGKPIHQKRTEHEGWDGKQNEQKRVGRIAEYLQKVGLTPDLHSDEGRMMGATLPSSVSINPEGDPHDQQLIHEAAHAMLTPVGQSLPEYQDFIGKPGLEGKFKATAYRKEMQGMHGGGLPEQTAQHLEAGIARRSGVEPFRSPKRGLNPDSAEEKARRHAKKTLGLLDEGIHTFDPFTGEKQIGDSVNALINARARKDKSLIKPVQEKVHSRLKQNKDFDAEEFLAASEKDYFGVGSSLKKAAIDLTKAPQILDQDEDWADSAIKNFSFNPKIHELHKTYKLNDGKFYHVYHEPHTDDMKVHAISEHKDPSKKPLSVLFTNQDFTKDGDRRTVASITGTDPLHQGKGHGTRLKKLATKFHGELFSDGIISEREHKSWKKLKGDKNLDTFVAPTQYDLADQEEGDHFAYEDEAQDERHTARYIPKPKKLAANEKQEPNLKKTLTAGMPVGAPSGLTGGEALQTESLDGKLEQISKDIPEKVQKKKKAKNYTRKGINKSEPLADKETEIIKQNKEKPEAKRKHKFKAAKWTHPNGHPRCIVCGDEERVGGICEPLSKSELYENWFFIDDFGIQKAEMPEKEGTFHPEFKTWITKRHPNGRMMYHHTPEKARAIDEAISNKKAHQKIMSSLPETHHQAYANMVKQVVTDPNRHFVPTEENGKQKIRARHLNELLSGSDSVKLDTSDPNHLTVHRQSHSKGINTGKTISIKIPTKERV